MKNVGENSLQIRNFFYINIKLIKFNFSLSKKKEITYAYRHIKHPNSTLRLYSKRDEKTIKCKTIFKQKVSKSRF